MDTEGNEPCSFTSWCARAAPSSKENVEKLGAGAEGNCSLLDPK